MKKLIVIAMLALFTTSCTQTTGSEDMRQGMGEKCECCQHMMDDMKECMMMENGKQCPMIGGKSCGCCGEMMKSGMKNTQAKPIPRKSSSVRNNEHQQHH